MLTIFHDAAVYFPMWAAPDLQAYRTDTFEGWVRQPAEIGPVMFSNSSPSYVLLTPVGAEGADDGGVNWLLIGGIAAVVLIGGGLLIANRRQGTSDERE
jgi:peptide/nickel transport system substrate-binding protein